MTIARSTTRFMALLAATAVIGACTADTSFRGRVESYFRENIADLSPRRATQGEFSVSRVEWVDDDTVRVTYSDEADVELVGIGDVVDDDGTVLVRNFRIDTTGTSASSFSSMSFSSASSVSSSSNISGMTSSVTSAMSVSSVSSGMTTSASSMTTVSSASSYSL